MGIVPASVSGSHRRRYISHGPRRVRRRVLATVLLPLLIVAAASVARAKEGFSRRSPGAEDAWANDPGIFPGGSQII